MSNSLGLEVASTLDRLLADLASTDRLLHTATSQVPDPTLLAALDEVGLAELSVPEELGGLGLELDQLCLVGWVGGRRLMPTLSRLKMTLVGPLVTGGPSGVPSAGARWGCGFPALASTPPGGGPAEVWTEEGASAALVVGERSSHVVDLGRPDSVVEPEPGVDPGQGRGRLSFDPGASTVLAGADHARIVDRARVLVIAELSGIADRVTEVSVDYARQRSQFGRPLTAFQAIQHKLADMRAGCELIRSAVSRLAWLEEPRPELTASLGAATASVARQVAEDAIQVHGGMGFAWEYGIHLYYRRCLALQQQLGGTESLRRFVGRSIIARRRTR
jgi:alkylation response protein AidB-like acyl-CoA dehydrogenase